MKIDNEFRVGVPVDRAWQALTDLEGLAPCMPGAQLTGIEGDVHRGRVKVKVGPVISQFTGTARFTEKDDAGRHAVVAAAGKDTRGGGNASATIDLRLRPDTPDGTAVTVRTDLTISGKLAQFGAGMIKEISEKLLTQFVHNLEAQLHTSPAAGSPTEGGAAPGAVSEGGAAAGAASEGGAAPGPVSEDSGAPAAGVGAGASPGAVSEGGAAAGPASEDSGAPAAGGDAGAAADVASRSAGSSGVPAVNGVSDGGGSAAEGSPAVSDGDGVSHGGAAAADAGAPAVNGVSAGATGGVGEEPAEPEALDLLGLAGGAVYKRVVPLVVGVLVVVGVVVWLIVR
ncbi:SRPBCC family protein [Actinacidiphila alni]|uniref:SRPBCC family protein n=1 Tax=Actinacidiphila alni TaxID=380248 RepID=UPI0033F1786E